jgi:hypothetical protein
MVLYLEVTTRVLLEQSKRAANGRPLSKESQGGLSRIAELADWHGHLVISSLKAALRAILPRRAIGSCVKFGYRCSRGSLLSLPLAGPSRHIRAF